MRRMSDPTPLHEFARSRTRPVKRSLTPLNGLLLWLDAQILWRFARPRRLTAMVAAIQTERAALSTISDADLAQRLQAPPVRAADLTARASAPAHATVAEMLRRHLGFALRDNQIACALALLSGDCVELRTGEGKTLAAGYAALLAARSGVSVHVLTVNDYLAQRDHDSLAPFAAALGLTSAVITLATPDADRRAAYDSDIVYGTNKTFVFDHLRDRRDRALRRATQPRQMGQALAICDEADSLLIDEATIPMILSETGNALPAADLRLFADLVGFARSLVLGTEARADRRGQWHLTGAGLSRLERAAQGWPHPVARSEEVIGLAETALTACYRFRPGEAYLVAEDKVVMIDPATGRFMPDRRWDYGLHQMVELAAGVPATPDAETVARMTQQSYFRQYRRLSGLTGTARECAAELWSVYGLPVRRVAAHAPSRLVNLGFRVFGKADAKWRWIAARAAAVAQTRAVLIGVNHVAEVEALHRVFVAQGIAVAVLDARSEADEAGLVAMAGQVGQITLATHLAGRGTDIALDAAVRAAGGLHVIIGSAMLSARLERQLYGRAGRAGDPGSYEIAISRADPTLTEGPRDPLSRLLRAGLRLPLAGVQRRCLAAFQARRDKFAVQARRRALLREQTLIQQLGYS